MKNRTLLIIGGIVVTGVIAYEVYKRFCKPMNEECEKAPVAKDDFRTAHDASEDYTTQATDVYEMRETVVHSIKERHSEAAKVMNESLNTIFFDSDKDEIVTENSENLGETSSEPNELLK